MANKKRLIDANVLMDSHWWESLTDDFDKARARIIVMSAPTVDAVEVVRCKDCKHWLHIEDGFGDCTNGRFHLDNHADPTMEADDFCSCGERKDKDA